MDYRRFGNDIVMRLDKGEEILSQMKVIAEKEKIKLASVAGLGAVSHFVAGIFDTSDMSYHKTSHDGYFEISSLVGNINTMNGEFYTHLHINCADKTNNVTGGHLNEAIISATAEIFIHVIDAVVDREFNKEVGINTFKFV